MATRSWWGTAARAAGQVLGAVLRERTRATARARRTPSGTVPRPPSSAPSVRAAVTTHTGRFRPVYDPHPDGRPDPGEVVWAWVPFEDDPARGKDRPVLLVGRDGAHLLGLAMSSRDHDLDAADEARHGRTWVDVGTGPWDRRGRPSEVRLDRVLRIPGAAVRREGAVLPRDRFDAVVGSLAALRSW